MQKKLDLFKMAQEDSNGDFDSVGELHAKEGVFAYVEASNPRPCLQMHPVYL